MDTGSLEVPSALRQLWRDARKQRWTREPIQLTLGWKSVDPAQRRALEQLVLRESGWFAVPADEYEPECDPLEFIAFTVVRNPTLAELEARVNHVQKVSRSSGAVASRLGLGIPSEVRFEGER